MFKAAWLVTGCFDLGETCVLNNKKSLALAGTADKIKIFFQNMVSPKLFSDSKFYKIVFRLALPVTLQSFIMASLHMVDNIMVGQLGETPIAAVGLSNQVYFNLHLYINAVAGSCSIFISQFWGKKDRVSIRRILGLGLIVNFVSAFLFFLAGALIPEKILALFSDDPELISIGVDYLRITAFSYVMMAITATYSAALRSMEEVKLPMRASLIGLSINAVLNYVLIFGHFGFPKLGVSGAAIGTVIARLVEMGILLTATYGYKYLNIAKFKEMFRLPTDLVKRYFGMSSVVVAKDMVWAIGMTVYMGIYGRMGTEVVAVINITNTIRQLAMVFFIGLANACLIMVGKEIGSGDEEKAYIYSERFLLMTVVIGLFMGAVVFSLKDLLLLPYKISAETAAIAVRVLSVFSVIFFATVFNMVGIVGVLRSGGDATFCLIMDVVAVYVIGLPLAYLGGLVWGLTIYWVFALVNIQEFFKMFLVVKRFITRKWINNLVKEVT
jgi:putative MATE family efflux protein